MGFHWRITPVAIMNFLGLLSVLCLVLVSANAQKPKPCVSPPLMDGGFSLMDNTGMWSTTGKMNYDAFGQRMRIRTVDMAHNFTMTDMLLLFKEKSYYLIDHVHWRCEKRPLNCSFTPMHVPSDARFDMSMILGSSSGWGMGVQVNIWSSLTDTGMYQQVVTEIGCIPMTTTAWSWNGHGMDMTMMSTFNWVVGNPNPMDFVLPNFCRGKSLTVSEEEDTFMDAVKRLVKRNEEK